MIFEGGDYYLIQPIENDGSEIIFSFRIDKAIVSAVKPMSEPLGPEVEVFSLSLITRLKDLIDIVAHYLVEDLFR